MSQFFDLTEGTAKNGKSQGALKDSRQTRAQWLALFGSTQNLPSSVMKAERRRTAKAKNVEDKSQEGRSYYETSKWRNEVLKKDPETAKRLSKADQAAFTVSGGYGCGAGALSAFPQNVGRTMVLFYSQPGDTVFDPFAGHNSRMELTVREGRHYIGCDLSTKFMKHNRERADVLRKKYPKTKIKLYHTDSRDIPARDEVGDFTITSPPYWNIEDYGDEPEQLGKLAGGYAGFLDGMQQVMRENFRCLRPGAYAVYFINDFRRDGVWYSYHVDVIRMGIAAGFINHDLIVSDFGPGIRDIFLGQTMSRDPLILPKRHEFGIVFRKPK